MYITDLETNLKGHKTCKLSPLTILKGKNQTGKSSVLDAYCLVVTGEAHSPHVVKDSKELWKWKPQLDSRLFIKATTSENNEISWDQTSAMKVDKPSEFFGVALSPITQALLYGRPEALIAKIMQATEVKSSAKITDYLPDEYVAKLHEVLPEGSSNAQAVEAIKTLDKKVRALKKKLAELATEAQQAQNVSNWTQEKEQRYMNLWGRHQQGGVIETPIDQSALQAELHALSAKISLLKSIQEIHKSIFSDQRPTCLVCGEAVDHLKLQTLSTHFNKRLEELKQEYGEKRAGLKTGGITLQEQAEMLQLEQEKATWVRARDHRNILEAQNRYSETKAIQRAIKAYVDKIANEAVKVVEKRINRFLPKSIRVTLDILDGIVDLRIDQFKTFKALSGMEKVLVVTAFAQALVPKDAPPIRFCIIDEVWPDSQRAGDFMRSAAKLLEKGKFTQILFAAVEWKRKVPNGWSMVDLDVQAEARQKLEHESKEKQLGLTEMLDPSQVVNEEITFPVNF